MPKKSLKILLVAILCTAFACDRTPPKEPYLLSNDQEIRKLERSDHKFCNSLDLNSGAANKSFNGDLYWHCRLSMAKYKLKTNVGSAKNLDYNAKISDLVTKISLNLSEAKESVFIKENKKIDARDHEKCVALGYDFDISDRFKTDQYLLCRKRLIDDQQLDPPYGVDAYLKYPNRSYNLSFVLDTRIDNETKRYKDTETNYPTCLKFFNDKENSKLCFAAQDQSRACLKELTGKRFKKESEQKTICQKQAYERFPDSFLRDGDQRQKDIEQAKINADLYNNNSFTALGIDAADIELFESGDTADAQYEAREKQKQLEKNVNSKKGIYSRYGLTKLRQKYIIACQQNADLIVQKYIDDETKICNDIGDYKPKEDLI